MIMTYGGDIELGGICGVNPHTILYGYGGLRIGSYTRFAAHSVVISATHGFENLSTSIYLQPLSRKGISIGSDVLGGSRGQNSRRCQHR